ncbi:death-associated inhibitor of apoptosis 1 isoform X1 [Pieris rapae]|uniref:death-associated inhibitor of apoptosis 1 isoform X1 n=1 Tax=Pieris rapae TaxID=64459 RepID=UPI001E281A14|nr:death-associated inhibitor of apoptosis 1 isoform X1 [Pieris rapae]XP_022114988.2 death-associated inhibitor of apoptosis 1 isoform X1 [Pieris rapae]XP_045490451.1 death-associated inhibitor of apoptosis 1 isoform X1 [Pieris rapae]XP_045490453.1 death-associated inhibitor of apoptosis 1 isoform X1 [Pieris rapae]
MEHGLDTDGNEAAVASTSAVANTASPITPQMMSQLFKRRPLVGQLVLPTSGCESNSTSPSTSPTAVSPTSSTDKTDNRDPLSFYPEDMHREEERLKTFDNWPVTFISPELLARNGFYYLGHGDEVRCAFCKVEIMRWVEGDDPAQDHSRWAPQCPFLRRQMGAGNVPLDATVSGGRDECGVRAPVTAAPVRMPGPVHSRYASEAARLRTFADWPRSMRQKPEELAEAGFFYTGHGDKTKCFYCDGGLKDWENDDVPWEQHARWFDRCAYVQLVKGRDYVQKVLAEAAIAEAPKKEKDTSSGDPAPPATTNTNTNTNTAPENEDTPVEDTKLCKICFAEERNVCFVPCGHVVACAKCALSTDKCPMCRRTFTNAVRLYFS